MLLVNAPMGNIFSDKGLGNLNDANFERIRLSRMELEKRIFRRKGEHGTDIGFDLNPGVKLSHGDVISNEEKRILIEQIPEKVITVKLKSNIPDAMVLLGHIIGNRHRPISIKGNEISFPIQADGEKEVFAKLFHGIINHIEMRIEEQIFLPMTGANVHEH